MKQAAGRFCAYVMASTVLVGVAGPIIFMWGDGRADAMPVLLRITLTAILLNLGGLAVTIAREWRNLTCPSHGGAK